jgi:Periplasmic binding protein-like domain
VLAVGVYKAAKVLQLTIPDDLSVVGIDDSMIARILDPELTTVVIPAESVGQQALRLLLEVVRGGGVPHSSTVPLELVIRESTAPVRSARRSKLERLRSQGVTVSENVSCRIARIGRSATVRASQPRAGTPAPRAVFPPRLRSPLQNRIWPVQRHHE